MYYIERGLKEPNIDEDENYLMDADSTNMHEYYLRYGGSSQYTISIANSLWKLIDNF